MRLIKVRVNRTIEYEVSVPVEEDHRYEQVKNYLETIDWETDNEGRLTNRNLKLRDY